MARPANAAALLVFHTLWGDKRTRSQPHCLGLPSSITVPQSHTRFSKSRAWNGTSRAACLDRKKLTNDSVKSKLHRAAQFMRRCVNGYIEPWRVQSSTTL